MGLVIRLINTFITVDSLKIQLSTNNSVWDSGTAVPAQHITTVTASVPCLLELCSDLCWLCPRTVLLNGCNLS